MYRSLVSLLPLPLITTDVVAGKRIEIGAYWSSTKTLLLDTAKPIVWHGSPLIDDGKGDKFYNQTGLAFAPSDGSADILVPRVMSIHPPVVKPGGGDTIRINGVNFYDKAFTITIGSRREPCASITVVSITEATCVVPSGVGTHVPVFVSSDGIAGAGRERDRETERDKRERETERPRDRETERPRDQETERPRNRETTIPW